MEGVSTRFHVRTGKGGRPYKSEGGRWRGGVCGYRQWRHSIGKGGRGAGRRKEGDEEAYAPRRKGRTGKQERDDATTEMLLKGL